jgi:phosphoglycerate dehydrogenase-like enzyme
MKVVFHFDGSERLRARVAALSGDGIEVELCPETDAAAFERLLPGIEVLWHIIKPVTAEVISRAPKLKLVQKIGSGVNTIAVDACQVRGIAVCNLPGSNSRAVAELALLLMLACLRRLRELDAGARRPEGWPAAWALQDNFGELGGRTVGLAGYGAVARLLHPMLEALGARVLYWSRSKSNASLDELLARSDIVSLHLPLTPETERMLDPRRMKRGAILVNTARGALLDEAALAQALRSGHLSAAGLDVFGIEPPPADSPLLALPNVISSHGSPGNARAQPRRGAGERSASMGPLLANRVNRLA